MKVIFTFLCFGLTLALEQEMRMQNLSLRDCGQEFPTDLILNEQLLIVGEIRTEDETSIMNSSGIYLLDVPKDGRLIQFDFKGIFNEDRSQECSLQYLNVALYRLNSHEEIFERIQQPVPVYGSYNEEVSTTSLQWNMKTNDSLGVIIPNTNKRTERGTACPSPVVLVEMQCSDVLYSPLTKNLAKLNKITLKRRRRIINVQFTMDLNPSSNSYIRVVGGTLGFVASFIIGSVAVIVCVTMNRRKCIAKKHLPNPSYEFSTASLGPSSTGCEKHEYQSINEVEKRTVLTQDYDNPTAIETLAQHDYEKQDSREQDFIQSYDEPMSPKIIDEQKYDDMEAIKTPMHLTMSINPYFPPACLKNDIITQLRDDINIPIFSNQDLRCDKVLGSGAFGKVFKGILSQDNVKEEVAVKTVDGEASCEDTVKFLQEAAIMAQFNIHPGILSILGVVTEPSVMIVIDLMEGGDLRQHLIKRMKQNLHNLDIEEVKGFLLSYTRQIGCGMAFLEKKGYVHRDLAARNILISKDGTTCKVSDFGLSRELQSDSFYLSHGGKVPVRWTAPEALKYRLYSSASDIWSYGCVLYEIWSLGYKPFHDMKNVEILGHVMKGCRLHPPPGTPKTIYQLMITSWHPDASKRGSFEKLSHTLLKPDFMILKWSKEDLNKYDEEMITIGAPLEKGQGLFMEMQQMYYDQN